MDPPIPSSLLRVDQARVWLEFVEGGVSGDLDRENHWKEADAMG